MVQASAALGVAVSPERCWNGDFQDLFAFFRFPHLPASFVSIAHNSLLCVVDFDTGRPAVGLRARLAPISHSGQRHLSFLSYGLDDSVPSAWALTKRNLRSDVPQRETCVSTK